MNKVAINTRLIFGLIKSAQALGSRMNKEDYVQQVSKGRTTHLNELTDAEYIDLERFLKSIAKPQQREAKASDKADKMRKKIFSICHEKMWFKNANGTINIKALDDWMKKYSYLHKSLNAYTYTELPRLVSQIERISYKDYNKQITK